SSASKNYRSGASTRTERLSGGSGRTYDPLVISLSPCSGLLHPFAERFHQPSRCFMSDVQPIPSGHPAIVPHLVVRGAAEAIDFYIRAFGAEEVARMTMPDGTGILHAELKIGTARIFLCDETPTMERWVSPKSLNGTTVTLNLWTDNADQIFAQAVKAGAKVVMPL